MWEGQSRTLLLLTKEPFSYALTLSILKFIKIASDTNYRMSQTLDVTLYELKYRMAAHVVLCLYTVSAIILSIQREIGSTQTQNLFTFHATSKLSDLTMTCIGCNN